MNLKQKFLAAGLAAIIAGFGIFAANINSAQAQTNSSQANTTIAQMMQMIESLKQQIQQLIALIAQLKPQETCGNGICRFGETAASCAADCDNETCVAAGGYLRGNGEKSNKTCCPGLTKVFDQWELGKDGTCYALDNYGYYCLKCGDGICGTGENKCNCPADCQKATADCVKEGLKNYFGKPACCAGLTPVANSIKTAGGDCEATNNGASVCVNCGNGICGQGENECNCPKDCAQIKSDKLNCVINADCVEECGFGDCVAAKWHQQLNCGAGSGSACQCDNGKCAKKTTCGNGACETGETAATCPADCQNIVGGNCAYKTYAGTCVKTGINANGTNFTFTPFETPDISGTFLTSASQINPYRGVTAEWRVTNLTKMSCMLKVITSGACTPIIMSLVLSFD